MKVVVIVVATGASAETKKRRKPLAVTDGVNNQGRIELILNQMTCLPL